ncbi:MAG: hypothetical protein OEW39_09885 [Deltaproteobacteria bacterium]|nr:hypothetical protein [Deltaproteobacteria bacterium]
MTASVALHVLHRPDLVAAYWRVPGAESRPFEGVAEYVLQVERIPPQCLTCEALESKAYRLDPKRATPLASTRLVPGALFEAGGVLYFVLPTPGQEQTPGLLRIRLAVGYGIGLAPFSNPVLLQPSLKIPPGDLSWETMPGAGTSASSLRLLWHPPREGTETHLRSGGIALEVERKYRANLYRRKPGEPWPMAPLNSRPLQEGPWMLTRESETPVANEYILRYVDAAGAEGLPSAPVQPFASVAGDKP